MRLKVKFPTADYVRKMSLSRQTLTLREDLTVPTRLSGPFFSFLLLFVAGSVGGGGDTKQQSKNLIRKGDRISIIGNTLADRMQHDGWLETLLYARFPEHDLVFRNLGFAADEIKTRPRSEAFGSPDEWLARNKTDVVFAFFGYNESFAGKEGLEKFKSDLESFIKHTQKQKYNGTASPRFVLFSPTAHENLNDPNLSDGKANNERLATYTAAMAEVAKANNVPFVNLFQPTKARFDEAGTARNTINGVHLNEMGNKLVADIINRALVAKDPPDVTTESLEKIRQAVLDKNFHWFNRYRTVDGYSIYGGRSHLKFANGYLPFVQVPFRRTNREVMQREMEILDVMTANRDKRIWAVAQGRDMKVDDTNVPPFIDVITNLSGPLEGGKHQFLDGEEAIQKMKVAQGMKINLFASEKDFPELVNPVQMQFDTKGRLWVAVWPTYPHWKPGDKMNDKLLVLEDTKGTGKADKLTIFADGLHCPTGFEFFNGGVLVAQAPDLLYLKDEDGKGKATLRKRVLSGIDSADTHHTANSFVLDPGGALYFQEGVFHRTGVETPYGPPVRCIDAGVYRYEPRTQKFELYVGYGFANPHGHVFDRWGQDIVVDGTGAEPFHGALFSGQLDFPHRHARPPQVYKQKTRPCAGVEILSSRHFPDENQGNLLVTNVIGFQGILQYKVQDNGASFKATEVEPIVSSSDRNFRPSDIRVGPDGAIYFIDWHNPIIGHMQHNLRDPNRDREHGRIYRVTHVNRPLVADLQIAGEPIAKLFDLLKSPEDRVRHRARIELGGRKTDEVMGAVQKFLGALDPKDKDYEHHRLEGLWAHQYQNVVNEDLLRQVLRSPDFRARAAATRVLCYWRDRVKEPLDMLRVQINDEHPRVRLEAIRALSFFHDEKALSVALELLAHPDDEYLRFVFNETLNTLERRVGSKLDRKNIAQSLVNIVASKKVAADRLPALVETICRHGGTKELNAAWELSLDENGHPVGLRRQILEWLADAAATRGVQPDVEPRAVSKLIRLENPLLAETIRLATAWKMTAVAGDVMTIPANDKVAPAARLAAIDAVAALGGGSHKEMLQRYSMDAFPLSIRLHAAAALARVDLKLGAAHAAEVLAVAKDNDDLSPLVSTFLARKTGPGTLANALTKQKLSADAAKRVLRAMVLAGSNDAELLAVVTKQAGLDAAIKAPTPDEIVQLGKDALANGDAARGERVFRRADLGCMKCHAISKAGGNIGPDLGPIGASSPLDYIISSILDPSQSIKEEYLTKVITTQSGLTITGIVLERNKNVVVLKDATGTLHRIRIGDIDTEEKGKSLMPEGITRTLTRGELIDLVRFVSELGKPGPFALKNGGTATRWRMLRDVPAPIATDVPNRDLLRDHLLQPQQDAWAAVYALVDGRVPVTDLRGSGSKFAYAQTEVFVTQAGVVDFRLEAPAQTFAWLDEEALGKNGKSGVELSVGRHLITVRVPLAENAGEALRLELRTPTGSRARFEVGVQ